MRVKILCFQHWFYDMKNVSNVKIDVGRDKTMMFFYQFSSLDVLKKDIDVKTSYKMTIDRV